MRLFVGIALSPDSASALAKVRERFEPAAGADLRWSAPEGWHITLQFLGQVSDERAASVLEQLRTIHSASVPIRIDGLGFFERAGIFWAGIVLTPDLLALQQFVTAAMRNCGFVPENRPYSPHITLARVGGHAGRRALASFQKRVDKNKVQVQSAFLAEEFLLYESLPGPEGSRYEVRARFPLKS